MMSVLTKVPRLIMAVGVLFFALTSQALAIPDEYESLFGKRIYYFDPISSDNTACEAGFVGDNNAEVAFNYFLSKELTPKQVAGIIGNLQVEAPGLDPKAEEGGGGPGRGIAQWTLTARWATLLQYAEDRNRDPLTLELQLDFMWHELTYDPEYYGLTDLKKTTTVEAAVVVFLEKYEKAGTPHLDLRLTKAQEAYDAYKENGDNPANSSDRCASLGSAGPFSAFPLITTKTAIKKGSRTDDGRLFVWSYEATTNAHHDYNAADIHADPGTKVVAALDGEVVAATEEQDTNSSPGVGSRITLRSKNGEYINYYAHLAFGSIRVKVGDSVSAGKVIAEIGPDEQAQNTGPHVHIDLLPRPPHEFRVSCSGAACSGYEFIDLQGWMVKLYEDAVPN